MILEFSDSVVFWFFMLFAIEKKSNQIKYTTIFFFHQNLQFLNHVIIIKIKVLIFRSEMTLALAYPVRSFAFLAPKDF